MELGFDTIGNATVIAYDRGPVLVTDPWFEGDAYFGSWTLSHEVPPEQAAAIRAAPYCWVSHGHPDHLSLSSLRQLRRATILLPDHVGGRIAQALRDDGFTVVVLQDRSWVRLSDRIQVCSIADYNQDAILLIDVGGRLVIDLNDSSDRGWRRFVRDAASRYDISFLLQLGGFGDADMINLFAEDGARIPPASARRQAPGVELSRRARQLGARFVVPFSSMHRYQRTDSVWANEHTADLADYALGFDSEASELLPAFIRYDCLTDVAEPIDPRPRQLVPREPAEFGDDWDEPLDADDTAALDRYIRAVAHLGEHFEFIGFMVGGREHRVAWPGSRRRGRRPAVTFHVPRTSLMTAVDLQIFDDLLIGNFVRTTLHGTKDTGALYPDFTPYLCKYADNGGARSAEELHAYFRAYRRREPVDFLRHRLEAGSVARVRGLVPRDSRVYDVARSAYRRVAG